MSTSATFITRTLWLVAAATVAVLALTVTADPAAAVDCSDFPYAGENGMINSDCRENTIDPGVGNILGHLDLMEPRARALLNENGFDDQWLWYAPIKRRTFHQSEGIEWSFCDTYNPGAGRFSFTSAGFVCDGGQPLGFTEVTGSFVANSVELSVFTWGGGFISRACGNFSRPPSVNPIPKIRVFKFHDLDRDGVQDPGEPPMAGVRFTVGRSSSRVGQGAAVLGTYTTNAAGYVVVPLNGHGPGRYYFEEQVPAGFINTTPGNRHSVTVPFGAANGTFDVAPFGNAEAETDVTKTFELVDAPEAMEVGVPAGFVVETTLTNLGPAGPVTVAETLTVTGPSDCTITQPYTSREVALGAPGDSDPPSQRTFRDTVTVTCAAPSFHSLTFTNDVAIVGSAITDVDNSNNSVTFDTTVPVFADADLALDNVALACDDTTQVDAAFGCTISGDVVNHGPFGPVDADLQLQVDLPADCTGAASIEVAFDGVAAGESVPFSQRWELTCGDRSFHDITATATLAARDIHVVDAAGNNQASDTDRVEVFEDVDLAVTDVHLECDEVVGAGPFTCRADVDVANHGPATGVTAFVYADLSLSDECTVTPDRQLTSAPFRLDAGDSRRVELFWSVSCPASDVLHPFTVTTDIGVDLDADPHAVDQPHPETDTHVVPYCVETVNPHGKQVPQAPGQGQNEDGFYEIGTLPDAAGADVWVRDTGTGTLFGPFPAGTKVKYIEANGAEPSITPMGSNNGKGNGKAEAVDYQIKGQGDMEVVVFDEDGGEVTTACLVPPLPK